MLRRRWYASQQMDRIVISETNTPLATVDLKQRKRVSDNHVVQLTRLDSDSHGGMYTRFRACVAIEVGYKGT